MSRVEQLEQQIVELDQDELRVLRDWFMRMDAELWDRQFESDVRNGKLSSLAQKALRDHESGLSKEL